MSFTEQDVLRAVESSIDGDENVMTYKYRLGGTEYPAIEDFYSLGDGQGTIVLNDVTYFWKGVDNVGGEGQGDYAAAIFAIETDDGLRYFRKEGYYSSYEGTDWYDGGFDEVEPYEKTVRDYRKV